MTTKIADHLLHFELKNFSIKTLQIQSEVLKANPLKDPFQRFNPVLIPHTKPPWPVVFVLGGFTGNAPFYFNLKFNEQNTVSAIDSAAGKGEAPQAIYVFVDALTAWGGSQFINSTATGYYEDYIINEIIPTLQAHFPVAESPSLWAVVGGSSGGYGALHLASKYPDKFRWLGAIAPDSFFDASLLPDLYQALPEWEKYKFSSHKILEDVKSGKISKKKNWHHLLNAFGMAACYSPQGDDGQFTLPFDLPSGLLNSQQWQKWKTMDPLHFLLQRIEKLKKLEGIYLSAGDRDNYHLQYGSRQISIVFKNHKITHEYLEFEGNHFDIGERRPELWKWLAKKWGSNK